MNETDTRDVLIAICQTLKAEYVYLGSLQRSVYALIQALKIGNSAIEDLYDQQIRKAVSIEHPATAEQIQRVDALLEKLKKL